MEDKTFIATPGHARRRAIMRRPRWAIPCAGSRPGPTGKPYRAHAVQNDLMDTGLHPIAEGATPIPSARYPNGLEP